MSLDPVLARIDANLDAALARLIELLKIQSVSTDSDYDAETRRAGEWLVDDLRSMGVDAELRDTPGHPMVVGHAGDSGPHVLFYGHYDVQPVDPIELWRRDPFDPAVEGEGDAAVIRGRGTADDKGQLMTFVEAVRAWKAETGDWPCRITFLFEGEEESGSPSLIPFLEANRDELSAPDIALICDTGMFDRDTPAITTMLRGMMKEEFTIHAARIDLHSGMYGGPAINPNRVLAKIITGLHDDEGRVTLPGFYDGVVETPDDIMAQWEALGFDAEKFLGDVGLSEPAGETGRTVLEQIWARPTAEVNGMWGGYTGRGFKTVLPAEAHGKISFRLVGTQDPAAISRAFRAYVDDLLPPDCSVSWHSYEGSPASVMDTSDPKFETARAALSDEWPNEAAFIGGGGSIPIAGYFKTILGLDSMLIGFGLDDDAIHSPNEKYDVRSFHKGTRSWARVLAALRG